MEIFGPSGLRCEARPFKGREIMDLVEALEETESMGDDAMTRLLTGTWLSTLDVGPYVKLETDAKPNWQNQVLKGDLLGLLLSLRVGTFPDGYDYVFKVRCEDPMCRHAVTWGTHITKNILSRVRPLPEESCGHLADGQLLPFNVAGTDVRFRLPTLASEAPMQKWIKQQRKRRLRRTKRQTVIDRMASQIVQLDGQRCSVPKAHAWVMNLDAPDLYKLRERMDLADVQIDSQLTVKCDECDLEFEADLPLGQSFLDPHILSRRDRWFGHLDAEHEQDSNPSQT